jgi:hypothetical protein
MHGLGSNRQRQQSGKIWPCNICGENSHATWICPLRAEVKTFVESRNKAKARSYPNGRGSIDDPFNDKNMDPEPSQKSESESRHLRDEQTRMRAEISAVQVATNELFRSKAISDDQAALEALRLQEEATNAYFAKHKPKAIPVISSVTIAAIQPKECDTTAQELAKRDEAKLRRREESAQQASRAATLEKGKEGDG